MDGIINVGRGYELSSAWKDLRLPYCFSLGHSVSSGIISNLMVLKPFATIYNFENLLKALHFFFRKNANMHISDTCMCVCVCVHVI